MIRKLFFTGIISSRTGKYSECPELSGRGREEQSPSREILNRFAGNLVDEAARACPKKEKFPACLVVYEKLI